MINNAARHLTLDESPAFQTSEAARPNADLATSAWLDPAETLALVLTAARFEAMLGEAASWADRITLCLTAQQAQASSVPWWGELLARGTKCDRIYLRRAEQVDGLLLHRLHETLALRLLDGGGKQVAGNLLMFARGGELRVLLSHIPLERALAGASYGALLSFRGRADGELARACRAQVESWAKRARSAPGSEIDALAFDARRAAPLPELTLPSSPPRIVSDAAELAACVQRFTAGLSAGNSPTRPAPLALASSAELAEVQLEGGAGVSVREVDGGYRIQLRQRGLARTPFVLTLCSGAAWGAGNALMLDLGEGQAALVWRGGLLGASRSREQLLWSQARLQTFSFEDGALGPAQPVALVAHTSAEPAPQLGAFARELQRLSEVFEVAPPPLLSDVVADFASLSPRQRTLLLWRALIGLGPLDFGVATLTAAQVLRNQGYLRGRDAERGSAPLGAIAELLAKAAESGAGFDVPAPGKIRAAQPDLAAYSEDDWLECLLCALPEAEVLARRSAIRLAFARARQFWGLCDYRLERKGVVERLLGAALDAAVRRGLLVRVGADGVQRLGPFAERPRRPSEDACGAALGAPDEGLLGGWSRELTRLSAVQHLILTRRAGWHARREAQLSVAQRLGLSLERARQLETEAWLQIEASSTWLGLLRGRLREAFAGARVVPVRRLAADDAFWQGVDEHLELADALFENVLGADTHRVVLRCARGELAFFARFSQTELDLALDGLLEQAARVATPAAFEEFQALAAAAAEPLDPRLAEDLLEALEAHLELDPEEPERVLAFVRSSAALEPASAQSAEVDSEQRLRLQDTVHSVFRAAGTPLSSEAVAARVRQRLDVEDDVLVPLLAVAPFVRRNADQYGLLSRDVPGGHEAIALALNSITLALESSQRPLPAQDALALVQARIKPAWSLELLCSLVGSDPALCLSPSQVIGFRRWGSGSGVASSGLICPGLPAAARARFEQRLTAPPGAPAQLVQRLRAALSRLESAAVDDLVLGSLARQMCDLYERLLEHVARGPVPHQQLVQAALGQLLDAVDGDEDEDAGSSVDREALTAARGVLAAVLRQLELDWI